MVPRAVDLGKHGVGYRLPGDEVQVRGGGHRSPARVHGDEAGGFGLTDRDVQHDRRSSSRR